MHLFAAALSKRIALPLRSKISLSALTNMPCLGLQVKYLTPPTLPSFLPKQHSLDKKSKIFHN